MTIDIISFTHHKNVIQIKRGRAVMSFQPPFFILKLNSLRELNDALRRFFNPFYECSKLYVLCLLFQVVWHSLPLNIKYPILVAYSTIYVFKE